MDLSKTDDKDPKKDPTVSVRPATTPGAGGGGSGAGAEEEKKKDKEGKQGEGPKLPGTASSASVAVVKVREGLFFCSVTAKRKGGALEEEGVGYRRNWRERERVTIVSLAVSLR